MSLKRIALRDFVIVRELELDPGEGFSVLTGETGAGKSILVDALQLALGARAEATVVREGATRAEISAEFDSPPALLPWLQEAGWTRDALAPITRAIDPAAAPALAPTRIVSVLGETDRWVPYDHGLALARQWQLPESNVFRYRLGHLGMPVQLTRDPAPFERLRQVLRAS